MYIRLDDAKVEAIACGIATNSDGEMAVMIQIDTTVVVMDAESAMNFVAGVVAVLPFVMSGEVPEGLIPVGIDAKAKAIRKAVKANKTVLRLE